jgi:chromosome segregation ATPase
MSLACRSCGQLTQVPKPEAPRADAANQLDEVQRKLKENESQRTEVTGYINQLSIQLHRWQLRLQTLSERKEQLEKELP